MAIPENRKIPAEQLSGIEGVINDNVPDAEPSQFDLGGTGFLQLNTPYKTITANFPTVTFEASKIQGSVSSPQYYSLGFNLANAKHKNNVLVRHSSAVIPEALVNPKPESLLITYADQAAMLADQINQISGDYYYYTGSTSAWQWDGTSGGVIGNYTEKVEGVDWEEWGAKPDYVIVQGDTYLVGTDNYNVLDCAYYDEIIISTVAYYGVVVVNITNYANGNQDTEANKLNVYLAIWHKYNENNDPATEEIINSSPYYSQLIETQLLRPTASSPASYEDLGGGNYALVQGLGSTTQSNRSERQIPISSIYNRLIAQTQEVTLIYRKNFPTNEFSTTGGIGMWISRNLSDQHGFNITYSSVNESITVGWTNNTNTSRTAASSINKITLGTHYYDIGVTIKVLSSTEIRVNIYIKSVDNSVLFENILNIVNTNAVNSGVTLETSLDILMDGGTYRPAKDDEFRFYAKELTSSEVEAQFNFQPSI